jgi:DNA-binding XRE family transcriptional regulator
MTVSLAKISKPLIVIPDMQAKEHLCQPGLFRIATEAKKIGPNEIALLILPLSALATHKKKEFGLFKAVFVQSDVNANAILDNIGLKKAKSKFYIFDKWQELNRILLAWHDGVEDDTIAAAWVAVDRLVIESCAIKRYSVAFKSIPALAKIAANDRVKFRIHEFGNYLYWPNYDVHLNIESIKYHTDKKYREQKALEQIAYNKDYGQAIIELRKRHSLTQKRIEKLVGLSARQLYRVEAAGHSPTITLLEKLASAHKLKLNDYLNALAETIQERKSTLNAKKAVKRASKAVS